MVVGAAVASAHRLHAVVGRHCGLTMADAVPDTFQLPTTYKPPVIRLPEIGCGTLGWGDPRRGWGLNYNSTDLAEAYAVLTEGGVGLFDTSEIWGYEGMRLAEGSEQLLGALAAKSADPPLISTKFMPVPWTNLLVGGGVRIGRRAVVDALRASIARLGVGAVDIYSVHAPLPYVGGRRALYEGLAEAYELGLCRGVGLANFAAPQLREADAALRRLGVPLVCNAFRYSVMNVERELDGTIDTCLELGVAPVAHTPLARGLIGPRYAQALAGPGAPRGRVGRLEGRQLLSLRRMFDTLAAVGDAHGGVSAQQVALRFAIAKGCVPLPGVTTGAHAAEVVKALSWELDLDEVAALDEQAFVLHLRRQDLPWLRRL